MSNTPISLDVSTAGLNARTNTNQPNNANEGPKTVTPSNQPDTETVQRFEKIVGDGTTQEAMPSSLSTFAQLSSLFSLTAEGRNRRTASDAQSASPAESKPKQEKKPVNSGVSENRVQLQHADQIVATKPISSNEMNKHSDANDSTPNPSSSITQQTPSTFGLPSSAFTRQSAGLADDQVERWSQAIQRLMVSDTSTGQRRVRMDLTEDVLPGVSVSVFEDKGSLAVEFECSHEPSRLLLNQKSPGLTQDLAQCLQRDVVVRVMTDDQGDRCLVENFARAG